MSINIEERELVVPGQMLAEGNYVPGENTYKEGEKIYSQSLGLFNLSNKKPTVVPLKSCYIPSVGDYVIGVVTDVEIFGCLVDINAPYPALLPSSDIVGRRHRDRGNSGARERRPMFNVGTLVKAKVIAFDRTRDPLITIRERGLGRITSGKIIKFSPAKIPRLIGKEGSMINMLKKETSSQISVGRNGIVLISGPSDDDEQLALWAIKKIEAEAHTSGLTDRLFEDIKKRRR